MSLSAFFSQSETRFPALRNHAVYVHVFASSFDWFTGLAKVITLVQGLGFTILSAPPPQRLLQWGKRRKKHGEGEGGGKCKKARKMGSGGTTVRREISFPFFPGSARLLLSSPHFPPYEKFKTGLCGEERRVVENHSIYLLNLFRERRVYDCFELLYCGSI